MMSLDEFLEQKETKKTTKLQFTYNIISGNFEIKNVDEGVFFLL